MDLSKLNYAVLCGDARQSYLFRILQEKGLQVEPYGILGQTDPKNWEEIVARADCLLMPLPMTQDGVRLFSVSESEPIRLDLLAKCGKKILFGGKIPERFRKMAEAGGAVVFDYFESETLQTLNALPTAEGAIFTAMKELPITIEGSSFAVIGYGRIGRLLADRLALLGANVIVYERKSEKHPYIRFSHATPLAFSDADGKNLLCELPTACRAVFNTVPERLFTKEVLERFPKNCLFVDLASPPGGIDPIAADECGIRRIWATALPGKYAPESAASYLAKVIFSSLQNLAL